MNAQSSSVIERLESAGIGGKITVLPSAEVPSIADLRKLDDREIGTKLAVAARKMDSDTLENGKLVFVLKERQPESYKTLKKWVKKITGIEARSELYKIAIAFRMVGVPGANGSLYGEITEPEFDRAPLRWMMTTAAILNKLDKDFANDEIVVAKCREQVALVYRTIPKAGGDRLKAILKSLNPQETEIEEDLLRPYTAEELVLLVKGIKTRLELTADAPVRELAAKAFAALAELAKTEPQEDQPEAPKPSPRRQRRKAKEEEPKSAEGEEAAITPEAPEQEAAQMPGQQQQQQAATTA
jgi:hypothetical protein